jgi:Flp pilus assembly pilin Flp
MNNFRKNMRRFLPGLFGDQAGQSTTEYILILAVVVMVAMKFRSQFNSSLGTMLTGLNTQLQQASSPDSSTN